jgi:mannose-6-phosphate isomerase-like protein (cupin superfamily)
MPLDDRLLEIHDHAEPGYRPVVDYQAWRVAVLNWCEDLLPENLTRMQRHDETDEVFVLLAGRCVLFLGDGRVDAGCVHAVPMEPGRVYNVRRGVWHTHALSRDASVLVVENRDTTYANSPFCDLDPAQTRQIVADAREHLG